MDFWNEAFKWSSQYITHDPEKKKELKPLSKEDFEFLEKAFESISKNETKEFLKALTALQEKEEEPGNEKDLEFRLEKVDEMRQCADGLEVSRNIVRCCRFKEVLSMFFNTKHDELRLELARLISAMCQNDAKVQQDALENNVYCCLDFFEKDDKQLQEKIVILLCGMIFGEFIPSREKFVLEKNGFDLLKKVYGRFSFNRALKIIEDLTKPWDDEKYIPSSLTIKKKFFEEKVFEFALENLEKEFSSEPNIDEKDRKRIFFNILSNVASLFNEEQYNQYNELYKKLLNFMIKEKTITNDEVKNMIRISNEKIRNNFKTKKTFIDTCHIDISEYLQGKDGKDKPKEETVLALGN